MTISHQKCILKLQKAAEILDYTQSSSFLSKLEFYTVTSPFNLAKYCCRYSLAEKTDIRWIDIISQTQGLKYSLCLG